MSTCIIMNAQDNVATLLAHAVRGDDLTIIDTGKRAVSHITALEAIPFGHKIALRDLAEDDDVIKYGEKVGAATTEIKKGHHVHVHNVISIEGAKSIVES